MCPILVEKSALRECSTYACHCPRVKLSKFSMKFKNYIHRINLNTFT